jgi:sugar transferase (PEP-CTERM system associated)
MVRAWTVRSPSTTAQLVASGAVPPLAVSLLLALSSLGGAVSGAQLAGFGLLLVAYEAGFRWMGLDRLLLSRDLMRFLLRLLKACVVGFALTAVAFLLLPQASLGLAGAAAAGFTSAALVLAARSLLPRLLEPRTILDDVLILGRRDLAAKLCLDLLGGLPSDPRVGFVELNGDGRDGPALELDKLRELIRRRNITRIVVAEPDAETRHQITPVLLECRLMGIEVVDAVDYYQRRHGKLWLEAIDPDRLVFADGFRITPVYLRIKRYFDVVLALCLLVVAAPVLALVALAIRLESPGGVLFRQERVGQFGRRFELYKFRSMRADAERDGPRWARENDDRVTRIGRLLRRLHLDELPQIWNVLRGDLSFVGPRPERPCFVEQLQREIPYYDLRHFVKPGVTGWAQVCAPYASSVEESYEKLQYDLAYTKNLSFGLDLAIVARTAMSLLGGGGR